MNKAYLKYFLYLAVCFAACAYVHDLLKAFFESDFADFAHYYAFAKLMRTGADVWTENPALIEKIGVIMKGTGVARIPADLYQSSGFLLFVSPLTLLPYSWATLSWLIAAQAAFAASVVLLLRMMKNLDTWKVLSGLFLIFSFWPLREDLYLGQPNFFVLFFITLAVWCLKNEKTFYGGIFLGLAVQCKEIFFPLLALLLIRRYYRALTGALCALIVPKAVYICVFGMHNELSYWDKILRSHSWANLAMGDPFGLSVFSVLSKITGPGAGGIVRLLWAVFSVFLVWAAWLMFRKKSKTGRADVLLEFSAGIVVCLCLSPWVHETHLVVLSFAVLVCWMYLAENFQRANFLIFAVSYLLLGLKYPAATLGAGKTLGLILFFYLFYRIAKHNTAPSV